MRVKYMKGVFEIGWKRSLMAFYLPLAVCFSLWAVPGDQRKRPEPATGELIRDVQLLKDLDYGDLKSARHRLNDDGMVRIFTILENLGYTTNKAILCGQPGLRAAARYWRNDPLPPGLLTLQLNYPVVSNQIRCALSAVWSEVERNGQSNR